MPIEFRLPELGENITEAEVAEVLVKEGDEITAEQPVLELETEKAVVELPCPHAGRVTKVHVSDGDAIQVGAVLLTIEEGSGGREEAKQESPPKKQPEREREEAKQDSTEKKETKPERGREEPKREKTSAVETAKPQAAVAATPAPAKEERGDESPPPPAGPSTRHMARKLGVDLYQVTGTGSGGRITQEDVEAYVRDRLAASSQGFSKTPGNSPPLPDFSKFGPVERERLSKLNRTAAEHLSTSWHNVPHVTQHDLADVTEMDAARKRFLQTAGKAGPKVTFTAIAVKACVTLLQEMPRFNSSLDAAAGELVLKQYFHVGVAVDTEHGLVVPVIRDADRKTIIDIAGELTRLAAKARDRKLEPAEMQGANFTITNLGGIGGTSFTPIVNFPEVAILGMSRTRAVPRLIDGELEERLMLPLSLSYDHRVINGADAARFIVRLSSLLSQPFGLLANS